MSDQVNTTVRRDPRSLLAAARSICGARSAKEKLPLAVVVVCLLFAVGSMALAALTFMLHEPECPSYLRTEGNYCVVPSVPGGPAQ